MERTPSSVHIYSEYFIVGYSSLDVAGRKFLGFLGGVAEVSGLVVCDAPSLGNSFPTFRDGILVSSLRVLDVEISKYPRESFRILDFQFLRMRSVSYRNVWNQLSIDRASYPRSRLRIPQLVSFRNKVKSN